MSEYLPILALIVFACFALSISAFIVAVGKAKSGSKGETGPEGTNGTNGANGTNGEKGSLVKSVNISPFDIPQGTGQNIFQQANPTSSVVVEANSVRVGTVIRLCVLMTSNPADAFGDIFLIYGLASGTGFEFANLTLPNGDHPIGYSLTIDLTFSSLQSVNVNITQINDDPADFGTSFAYNGNVTFDTTVNQTLTLTATNYNIDSLTVNEVLLTQMNPI